MDLNNIIDKRRAYRALVPVEIDKVLIEDLAKSAQLAASCYNHQPWNFVFIYEKQVLKDFYEVLSKGNSWARESSMIIAVFSKKELDCVVKEREYYLFDTGMASAHLILRATELGLVAHPIAGFNESMAKEKLGIPDELRLITLIIIGKHAEDPARILEGKKLELELNRPERKELDKFIFYNKYKKK